MQYCSFTEEKESISCGVRETDKSMHSCNCTRHFFCCNTKIGLSLAVDIFSAYLSLFLTHSYDGHVILRLAFAFSVDVQISQSKCLSLSTWTSFHGSKKKFNSIRTQATNKWSNDRRMHSTTVHIQITIISVPILCIYFSLSLSANYCNFVMQIIN